MIENTIRDLHKLTDRIEGYLLDLEASDAEIERLEARIAELEYEKGESASDYADNIAELERIIAEQAEELDWAQWKLENVVQA